MKHIFLSMFLVALFTSSVYGQQDTLIYRYRSLAMGYQQAVKIAGKNLEGANAIVDASKARYKPRFDVNGSYNYYGNPIQLGANDNNPNGGELHNMYNVGLWVSQPLWTGGYLKNRKNVAIAQSGVAQSYVGLSEQNTMLQADGYYLMVVAKKETSVLTIKYRQAIEDFLKVIQDRVDEEIVGMNELYQVKVRYNDAQYAVIKMDKEFQVSLMELNMLIGAPLETQSPHMDSLLIVNWKQNGAQNIENAIEQRPEINIKQSEISLTQASEKVTASYYNPQLSVGGGITYGAPNQGLVSDPGGNYMLNAKLAIPIFYWGEKNDEVFAKQKITEQKELELAKTVDMVKLQVTSSYYELERTQEQVDFSNSALSNAQKNVEIMVDRYSEGLSSVLEVLDAQLFWQKSYLNYIEAKFELNIAYSSYLKALGTLSVNQ